MTMGAISPNPSLKENQEQKQKENDINSLLYFCDRGPLFQSPRSAITTLDIRCVKFDPAKTRFQAQFE
jgi:hypothetical protein